MVRNASGALLSKATSLLVVDLTRFYATTLVFQLGSAAPLLMRCFRIADGLNTITRLGEIGTSFPVFGFRPMRWPFLRTTKEPNDDNFTVSPRSRQSVISLSTNSTKDADSVRERPTF